MPTLARGGPLLENVNILEAVIYGPDEAWHWWLMAIWRLVLQELREADGSTNS